MGVDLTKTLFVRHAHRLSASELIVLGYMCLVALDKENGKGQPAGLYFGGWEPLALALGYDSIDTKAAKERVRKAVKGVREKGLIKPMVAHAQTGERQVYRILVTSTGPLIERPNRATDSGAQEGHRSGGDWATDSGAPRTDTGGRQDLRQDTTTPVPAQVTTAREDEKPGRTVHLFVGDNEDCDRCG